MAPGVAQVTAFTAKGDMRVRILDRTFEGTWKAVTAVEQLSLLATRWRGAREALSERPLGRAQLRDALGQVLNCEFMVEREFPSGVCEEPLRRQYYLSPDKGANVHE